LSVTARAPASSADARQARANASTLTALLYGAASSACASAKRPAPTCATNGDATAAADSSIGAPPRFCIRSVSARTWARLVSRALVIE
jgi:hypothetical protein